MSDPTEVKIPTVESQPSPYDVVQNNNVLPRNLFTSGMLPGNTIIRIGEKQIIIDGKNSQITVGVPAGQRFVLNGQENRIDFYDQTGASVGSIIGDYLQGQGIIISSLNIGAALNTNDVASFRGPVQIGILGTDGVLNLLGSNGNGATINALVNDLTLNAGTGRVIAGSKPIRGNGGFQSSGGSAGLTTNIQYQDWAGAFHTMLFENGLLVGST